LRGAVLFRVDVIKDDAYGRSSSIVGARQPHDATWGRHCSWLFLWRCVDAGGSGERDTGTAARRRSRPPKPANLNCSTTACVSCNFRVRKQQSDLSILFHYNLKFNGQVVDL
jgi:hypothetical protein